jgi:dihydrolipoamide dehydrogenase
VDERDLIVIGGGAAGFLAADRASQLGGKVTLVEKEELGGTCTNWGCIPMQFLLGNLMRVQSIKRAKENGINVSRVHIDYHRLIAAKSAVIQSRIDRMQDKLKTAQVKVVRGCGRLVSPNSVEVEREDGTREVLSAKKLLIAPGSVPKKLSIPGAEGEGVITVKEALEMSSVPKSVVIIGGGAIGLELATLWANLGSAVRVVELMAQLIPDEDHEIASLLEQVLRDDGVQIYTGVKLDRVDDGKGGKAVCISKEGEKLTLETEKVVFAIGHSPLIEGLGLEDAGVGISKGRIQTNKRMETNVKGIYAAGDVTGEIMLANVAMVQGSVAAENAMGRDSTMDYRVVPRGIRTFPEIGAIGITEKEAREKGLEVQISKYPFMRNAKASMVSEGSGFVKVIADSASGEVLGVHIIGPQATELIHEALLAMKMRGTVQDIAASIHGHPCLHEAIQQAAQRLCSEALY